MTTLTAENQLPALFKSVMMQQERCTDILVPITGLQAIVKTQTVMDEGGIGEVGRIAVKSVAGLEFFLDHRAMPQICTRVGPAGGSQQLIAKYMENLCGQSTEGLDMAVENLNFWMDRTPQRHPNGQNKNWFVRLMAESTLPEDFDANSTAIPLTARAVLSDHFFKIDNMDVIGAIHGAIKKIEGTESYRPSAGAQVLKWQLSDTKMTMMIVNPSIAFDLNNPEGGIITDGLNHSTEGGHYLRIDDGKKDGRHLVYPAACISNSETGHGGMNIKSGLYEAVCANGSMIGTNVAKRHTGAVVTNSSATIETANAKREVIMLEIRDAISSVFCENAFKESCASFSDMFKQTIEKDDVKRVITEVVAATKLPQCLIDDILQGYVPLVAGRDTFGDVQRAVTNLANDSELELALDLEKAGGDMVNMTARRQANLCHA